MWNNPARTGRETRDTSTARRENSQTLRPSRRNASISLRVELVGDQLALRIEPQAHGPREAALVVGGKRADAGMRLRGGGQVSTSRIDLLHGGAGGVARLRRTGEADLERADLRAGVVQRFAELPDARLQAWRNIAVDVQASPRRGAAPGGRGSATRRRGHGQCAWRLPQAVRVSAAFASLPRTRLELRRAFRNGPDLRPEKPEMHTVNATPSNARHRRLAECVEARPPSMAGAPCEPWVERTAA